jgi:hypothetical protein
VLQLLVVVPAITVHVTEHAPAATEFSNTVRAAVIGPEVSVSSTSVQPPSTLQKYCARCTFASHTSCALALDALHSRVAPTLTEIIGVGSGIGVPKIDIVGSTAGVSVAIGVTDGFAVGVAITASMGVAVSGGVTVIVAVGATSGVIVGASVDVG